MNKLKINGLTFYDFCIAVRGYDFYRNIGLGERKQYFKYQLFRKGYTPEDLIANLTIYDAEPRPKVKRLGV